MHMYILRLPNLLVFLGNAFIMGQLQSPLISSVVLFTSWSPGMQYVFKYKVWVCITHSDTSEPRVARWPFFPLDSRVTSDTLLALSAHVALFTLENNTFLFYSLCGLNNVFLNTCEHVITLAPSGPAGPASPSKPGSPCSKKTKCCFCAFIYIQSTFHRRIEHTPLFRLVLLPQRSPQARVTPAKTMKRQNKSPNTGGFTLSSKFMFFYYTSPFSQTAIMTNDVWQHICVCQAQADII